MSPGLAFREAIFRLSLRAGFLEKRENWRTPFTLDRKGRVRGSRILGNRSDVPGFGFPGGHLSAIAQGRLSRKARELAHPFYFSAITWRLPVYSPAKMLATRPGLPAFFRCLDRQLAFQPVYERAFGFKVIFECESRLTYNPAGHRRFNVNKLRQGVATMPPQWEVWSALRSEWYVDRELAVRNWHSLGLGSLWRFQRYRHLSRGRLCLEIINPPPDLHRTHWALCQHRKTETQKDHR